MTNTLRTAAAPAIFAALAIFLVQGRPAAACVFPTPARERTSIPADGDTSVPTSVLPRVTYKHGAYAQAQCGAAVPAPTIQLVVTGDGGAQADGGAPATIDVPGKWALATDEDPRDGFIWQFHPSAPLVPNATYQMIDAYPADCSCGGDGGCMAQAPGVFATFTTGAGPDTTRPSFSGIDAVLCTHDTCDAGNQACCGPYDHLTYHFGIADDATDDHLVGVHLYARKDGDAYDFTHPLGPLQISDPVDSPFATRWDVSLTPGTWHVIARAFDSSGNEDQNMVEQTFTFPLANDPQCAKSLEDAGAAEPDMALVFDMNRPMVDMTGPDASGDCTDPSCGAGGCALGGGQSFGGGLLALLMAGVVAAVVLRQRRR